MARIDHACIDRWEAHLVTRGADGREERHPHDQRPREGVRYEARSAASLFPQAFVSRVEAEAACVAAGKRLCSRREWQRACRFRGGGQAAGVYPYGDRREPGRCNTAKPHLLTLLFGPDARRWRYADFNAPALANQPGFLARTGEYEGCAGELGVADLVGNLHEWVSDRADRAFEAALRAEGIPRAYQHWAPGNAVFMGGFFSTHEELGPGCAFTTVAHDAGYHDYSTGFRCCRDAADLR
jgi:formylglycine-generating enzyme required for sulfatase activity